ncbi:hypothetical protein Agabi119p4_3356 [Agaricus bisporus var. burnettii]|uniref:KARI N-terminal Rossmann domain-containing protein n=1 Tax=Agaricus bisporus var. burnettii TaxID=192524 RepID=A0A8H7F723_AGABI|nr:hypothetical protein Agabi119p4_3356 [Agaricus bisporus var. burnettii]
MQIGSGRQVITPSISQGNSLESLGALRGLVLFASVDIFILRTVRRGIVLCIFSSAKIDHGAIVLEQGDDEALHSDPNEGETGELKEKEMEETETEEGLSGGEGRALAGGDSLGELHLFQDCHTYPHNSRLSFGNQGAAQALNLRDSGIPNDKICIANRDDSYAEDAKAKGFTVEHNFEKAASLADVLFILIPDQVQPKLFNNTILPHLKDDVTIVVASGYNVFFKLLQFKPKQDVVMVAPRMIGSSVRSLWLGKWLQVALAICKAIGATKAGAIASSAREETIMDLLAEQALWPNIIMLFREAFEVLQKAGCSDEALCYEMWMSKEPAEIFERTADEGFITQLKHHSTCSQFGQLNGALKLNGETAKRHFVDILYNQV